MYSSTIAAAAALLAAQGAIAYPASHFQKLQGRDIKGNPIVDLLLTLVDNVSGPDPNDPRFTNWTAPGPNDLRGPCPAMNTLANHGFIDHSGRNLYVPDIIRGAAEGMNTGIDFSAAVAGSHVLVSPNPLSLTINMDALDHHNFPIEHDMSFSRRDAYFGDDHTFWPTAWNQTFSQFDDPVTLQNWANARDVRRLDSETTNPQFALGPRGFLVNVGEVAILTQTLGGGPLADTAPKEWFRMIFEDQKLPYELGWRPPTIAPTLASIFAMGGRVFTKGDNPILEAMEITVGSYADAFAAVDPITGILANTAAIPGLAGLLSGIL